MILLTLLALSLAVALLTGGSLTALARVELRHGYLILVALALQVLVFSPWWHSHVAVLGLGNAVYILSLLLIGAPVVRNWRVPGMAILGLGWLSNAIVILANGGRMPASLAALQRAGLVASREAFEVARVTNSSLIGPDTTLWFLGDVMAIPSDLPLANVFSVGDVIIALGAAIFVLRCTRLRPLQRDALD